MTESQPGTSVDDYTPEQSSPEMAPGEIVLGTLTGIDAEGQPQVDYVDNPAGVPAVAITTVNVTRQHLSRQVALLFANGDYGKPVIVGFIHSPLYAMLENFAVQDYEEPNCDERIPISEPTTEGSRVAGEENSGFAYVDGEKVLIEGKKEVVLKCGEASITLTRAGKILIRGKYLLNRSSGVNRIMGGSVQVN